MWLGVGLLISGSSRLDLLSSASDFVRSDPVSPLKSLSCLGTPVPTFSRCQTGLPVSCLDFASTGFLLVPRALGQPDASSLVPESCRLDLTLVLRAFARPGSAMLVLDPSSFGSFLSTRSLARLDSALSAVDSLSSGSSPPPRSLSWTGFAVSACSIGALGLVLPLRGFAWSGSGLLVFGSACLDLASLVSGWAHVGSPVSLQGLGRPGALPLASCPLKLGSLMLLRALVWLDSSIFLASSIRPDTFMPVLGSSYPGSALLPHSCSCPEASLSPWSTCRKGVVLSASDFAHGGFPPVSRHLARSGLAASSSGLQRIEPLGETLVQLFLECIQSM